MSWVLGHQHRLLVSEVYRERKKINELPLCIAFQSKVGTSTGCTHAIACATIIAKYREHIAKSLLIVAHHYEYRGMAKYEIAVYQCELVAPIRVASCTRAS